MITVQKEEGKRIMAYRLGDEHPVITRLIQEGKVISHGNGKFEIFSQEASSAGEMAQTGDYLKIDSAGYPYPNEKAYFEKNHRSGSGPDEYEQIPQSLAAWLSAHPMCPEVQFLIDHK